MERKRDAIWLSQTNILRRVSHCCGKTHSKIMGLVSPPLKARHVLPKQIESVLKTKMAAHNKEETKLHNNNLKIKWECAIKQLTLCLRLTLDIHIEVDKIFCGKELRKVRNQTRPKWVWSTCSKNWKLNQDWWDKPTENHIWLPD